MFLKKRCLDMELLVEFYGTGGEMEFCAGRMVIDQRDRGDLDCSVSLLFDACCLVRKVLV